MRLKFRFDFALQSQYIKDKESKMADDDIIAWEEVPIMSKGWQMLGVILTGNMIYCIYCHHRQVWIKHEI